MLNNIYNWILTIIFYARLKFIEAPNSYPNLGIPQEKANTHMNPLLFFIF